MEDRMTEVLKLEIDGAIATLTLNRPEALNTLNDVMACALQEKTAEVAADHSVRCVILQGAGGHFMAGGDIAFFAACTQVPVEERHPKIHELIGLIHEVIVCIREMPKPVIASVSGAVAGFGVSLMSACDLAVAADNVKIASAYCQLGVSPDGGGTFFLPRLVGDKRAREIMYLGDRLTAQDALAMGLVNRVVAVDELGTTTRVLAQRLVKAPQQALLGSKRLLNRSQENTLAQQLSLEQESFADCAMTADFEEGIQAFIDKRPPQFG